jgi:hypothetical protein
VDQDGVARPSGQAFNNDGDGEPMSGYLDSAVSELGLARRDVLSGHEGFFLVGLGVQVLLDEEQAVVRDPIEPPTHPCDPAHVAVTGKKGSGRRRRLAKAAMWVAGSCPVGVDAALEA